MSERRCLFFAYSISNFAPPAAIKRCCFVELCDPLLTQNGTGAGSPGRKQWKIRPANSGKQRKTEPKWLRFSSRQPTDQKAGGSNPSRRATPKSLLAAMISGFLRPFLLKKLHIFGPVNRALFLREKICLTLV